MFMKLGRNNQSLYERNLDSCRAAILAMLDDFLGFFDMTSRDIPDQHCETLGVSLSVMLVNCQLGHAIPP